jgi:Putative adhesin
MSLSLRTTSLVAFMASTAGAQAAVGRADETWTTRERLDVGQRFHVSSPNGAITISKGSGRDVEIRGVKRADRGGSIEEMAFKVVRTAEGLVVCAVYEDDDRCTMEDGYRRARRNDRDGWNHRARASFTVQVPAGVFVEANTGNGEITINGAGNDVKANSGNGKVLISGTDGRVSANTGNGEVIVEDARGEVEVSTGNGNVRVSTSTGPVNANSGNGDISISMESVSRAADMRFSTGNGEIVLSVPSDFGAELDATTGSGRITTHLPMRIQGRIDPHSMRGTLGNGGGRLSLRSGNGDIEVRSAQH